MGWRTCHCISHPIMRLFSNEMFVKSNSASLNWMVDQSRNVLGTVISVPSDY